jgi:hypothetical protein
VREGAWHIGGGSNAMLDSVDHDDFETSTFGLTANAGKMIKHNLLVEGDFTYLNSDVEIGGGDIEETRLLLGGGVRYYFVDTNMGNTVPYARGLIGILHEDLDFFGADDDDTSPYLGIGVGAETFITEWLALDYGLRLIYAFDIFDDSLTDIGLYLGLSLWK